MTGGAGQAPGPGGPGGEARSVLRSAVADYGPPVLSNAAILEGICEDRLPDSPREASLVSIAARADVAAMLEQQAGGVGPDTAVRLTAAALADSRSIDPAAAIWVVGEFARALGYQVSDGLQPAVGAPPPSGVPVPPSGLPDPAAQQAGFGPWEAPGTGQAAYAPPGASMPPYPGQPYGTPYGPPPYAGPPVTGKVSGLAITAFVLGLLGFLILTAIVGIILGVVGLVRIRDNQRLYGKGLAIAGIALSGAWLVGFAILIGIAAANPSQPSSSGHLTRPETKNVLSLSPGDCFQYPGARIAILTVTVVPCTQAHNAQVYAKFPATGSSYPGPAGLHQQAAPGCRSRMAGNLDRSLITNTMTIQFLYPEPGSWAGGQRDISCLIVDTSRDLTTSLLVANPSG
jgi:uncharacterized protein DUF4190/putative regulator of septum formation